MQVGSLDPEVLASQADPFWTAHGAPADYIMPESPLQEETEADAGSSSRGADFE